MNYLIYDIKCVIFAFICITIYVMFDKKTKKIQVIDIIMIGILVLVSGLRCNFGSDSFNYYNQYNSVTDIYSNFWEAFNSTYQSGYISLCYIVYELIHFEFAIFWVVALITYPFIIIYARKKTQRPSIVFAMYILMGFFVSSNNILKQNIAMVIMFGAYYGFLKEKKYFGYVILTVIASKFHITAIIAGICIFLATKIEPNYKNFIKFILIGIIISIFYNVIAPFIINNMQILADYEEYLSLERSTTTIIRGTINVISYIIMYGILTIILLNKRKQIEELENNNCYREISFLFIAIMISIISIRNQTMNRIAMYLYQFIIFMIPSLFSLKYTIKAKKRYLTFFIFLFIGWFCLNNIVGAENRYYDYSTYLTDTPKQYY